MANMGTTTMNFHRMLRLILFLSVFVFGSCEEEIKWTPNEDAANAPLPLSMNQRQQLLQLDQTIRSSPDPNGTLQQVAEQNGMSPQDLVNMLEKNARDLAQDPSLIQPKTVVSVITKVLASVGVIISQSAKKNPRSFTLTVSILLLLIYSRIMIPRTGMHVSRGTTLFPPHQRYLQKLADSPTLERCPLSIQTKKTKWDDLKLESDGVEVHKLARSNELVQAVSAQFTLTIEDFVEEDDDEEEDLDAKEELLDLIFESASSTLLEREWTDFAPGSKPLKSAVSSKKHGVLMVPGLGAIGRYGLIRWQITQQLETDRDASVTLTSLKGDFFDGQIHLEARRYRSKVVLRAHLGVPKRGRKMNKKIASKVVNDLVESVERSISQRTRQSLARRSIGKRFKSASHARALERRSTRFDREKEIEEMAEDRRRRWQRTNPDAGRYRPSGHRQKSPNNC
jgi:hypothetical protein